MLRGAPSRLIMPPAIRVLKVGGSLLDFEFLPQRFLAWLDQQPLAANVLVVGGGKFADVARTWDARLKLGDELAHHVCLELMRATARLLSGRLSQHLESPIPVLSFAEVMRLRTSSDVFATADRALKILDAGRFMLEEEAQHDGVVLPKDWRATSDSIAARVAALLGADELVLLKSATAKPGATLLELAAAGYVDSFFPLVGFPAERTRFVNLRDFAG